MTPENKRILSTLQSLAAEGNLVGCFADIPVDVYHHPECPGISSTQLKGILKKSYKHYELERGKSTPDTRFGSAFHCFVNEPEAFVNTYQIIHGTKSEFLMPGKLALRDEDFITIQEMAKKLFAHPDAGPLLCGAQNEFTYFSMDQETGLLKKCRLDAFKDNVISDLKSCQDASREAFIRDSRKYLTRISAAYYLEIVSEVLGERLGDFRLIACEKLPPYEIAVYPVDQSSINTASLEIRRALKTIKEIQQNGSQAWRGYQLNNSPISI